MNIIKNIFKHFFIGLYTLIVTVPKYFILGIKYLFFSDKEEKKKIKKGFSLVTLIFSLLLYFICVFFISRWIVQKLKLDYLSKSIIESTKIIEKEENNIDDGTNQIENYISETKNNNSGYMNVDLTELISQNSDTVAWLKVNNTNVNYPVVQTTNNNYYLNHTFNKAENANGWVYGDYRDNFENFKNNTIIYGHNLLNKTMFGSLPWTLKSSWYKNKDNYDIYLSTRNANTIWRIFSIYTTEIETYYLRTKFIDNKEYEEFINKMKSRSIYDFKTDVNVNDKLLTLSTCDDSGTRRLVIQAKLTKLEFK